MHKQSGFTLIELVMVIVILGILAAVAVPKFIDLSGEAQQASVSSSAGALASASVMNFARKKAGGTATAVTDCAAMGTLLEGGTPTGHTITGTFAGTPALGDSTTCTLTYDADTSKNATFTGIYVN